MNKIIVSVIVPSYNCEIFIAETINCILAQDYPEIELLIIDDGSTDGTREIILSYGNKLRLITQSNAGVCAARNKGIQEAKGGYICLMDHDDYWHPDKISQQIKAFDVNPDVGVVYSDYTVWLANDNDTFKKPEIYCKAGDGKTVDDCYSGWIYHLLLLDSCMLTSTAMFRAEVFRKCGLFDELMPYGEDWELWIRISREYKYLKLCQSTTLYRQHNHQGSRKVRTKDYRTALLLAARKKWGLCSRDGRCVTEWQFRRQLAEYHAAYGLHLLSAGFKKTAMVSLFKAWLVFPIRLKYFLYIIAANIGWKPNW